MRLLPINNSNRSFVNRNNNIAHTKFKSISNNNKPQVRQYTGVASRDLAYASMFDNQIAKDLKLMGLI